jgi:predicted TPR repeat methyltransferase
MQTQDTIIQDKQSAVGYDLQARKTNWFGPEVVFGLTYEFVKSGESILDLGIGSGLSSILFHQAGLRVYGLDGSNEILKVCAAKQFAVELKQHDLRNVPLPYPAIAFNHVLAVAVLNSFHDLAPLFAEVARIIQGQGIFAFTVEAQKPGQSDGYAINRVEVANQPKAESAVRLFRHSDEYIARLLEANGFVLVRTLEFLAFQYPAEHKDVFFKTYITQKQRGVSA